MSARKKRPNRLGKNDAPPIVASAVNGVGGALSPPVHSPYGIFRRWWQGLSHRSRHWLINIALGMFIEVIVHVAGHGLHLKPIVDFQNWGLDLVTRAVQANCALMSSGDARSGKLAHVLTCPGAGNVPQVPLLVEVDAASWRNATWGGGEPDRAPRDAMLKLIERAFQLGARVVVVDVLIEDRSSMGAAAPPPRAEDVAFADGLDAMLASPNFGADRRLVLVRTERRPLAEDESIYFSEMRTSGPVDSVVAKSGGRIVLAAPYFRVGKDLLLRDWELFKISCVRLLAKDGAVRGGAEAASGLVKVVPSVQLVAAAFDLGLDTAALAPPPGRVAVDDPGITACTPFPMTETSEHEPMPSAGPGCADEDSGRNCRAGSTDEHMLGLRYWSSVRKAFAASSPLGELPHAGDPGNRVMFRLAMEDMPRLSALELLRGRGDEWQRFASLFKDRIVIIGQTFEESGDSFVTPLGQMPGAAVLANAVHSMRHHGLLQPPGSFQVYGMSLLLIVVVGYVFSRWSSMAGTLVASAAVVATAGVASFFLFAHGVWLDFAAPIVGIQIHKVWAAWEERREMSNLIKRNQTDHDGPNQTGIH